MTTKTRINGVEMDQLMGTINAVKQDPTLARFQFRTRTEWIDGARSKSRIKDFYGVGKEDNSRKRHFEMQGDEPQVLLGDNTAPNAVETVLHALASCLAVGVAYNAAARGIEIESIDFDITGDMDLQAFLGLSEEVRPGFENIKVDYRIKSDASPQEIDDLCAYVQKTSPVLDMLRNKVPVDVSIQNQ